ncbi:MAG: hypothetical protein EBU66_15115 [Bacteroidetes bacterium]|nr:hypothetical protein [Bacteroidota bacterium]
MSACNKDTETKLTEKFNELFKSLQQHKGGSGSKSKGFIQAFVSKFIDLYKIGIRCGIKSIKIEPLKVESPEPSTKYVDPSTFILPLITNEQEEYKYLDILRDDTNMTVTGFDINDKENILKIIKGLYKDTYEPDWLKDVIISSKIGEEITGEITERMSERFPKNIVFYKNFIKLLDHDIPPDKLEEFLMKLKPIIETEKQKCERAKLYHLKESLESILTKIDTILQSCKTNKIAVVNALMKVFLLDKSKQKDANELKQAFEQGLHIVEPPKKGGSLKCNKSLYKNYNKYKLQVSNMLFTKTGGGFSFNAVKNLIANFSKLVVCGAFPNKKYTIPDVVKFTFEDIGVDKSMLQALITRKRVKVTDYVKETDIPLIRKNLDDMIKNLEEHNAQLKQDIRRSPQNKDEYYEMFADNIQSIVKKQKILKKLQSYEDKDAKRTIKILTMIYPDHRTEIKDVFGKYYNVLK